MPTSHDIQNFQRVRAREKECPHRTGQTCSQIDRELGFTAAVNWDTCDQCFTGGETGKTVRSSFISLTRERIVQNIGKKPYPSHIVEAVTSGAPEALALNQRANAHKDRWDKVAHTWRAAASFARSLKSKGLTARRVALPVLETRQVSCFGNEQQAPCPALARNAAGKHYCNDCGCGDREVALLDGDDYPKLAFPYLECPRRRDGFSNATDLHTFFDRVVVLNLKRRPDRMKEFEDALLRVSWPFARPITIRAVDGHAVPGPLGWTDGGGAWGCLQSHVSILQRALEDGVQQLLVLEDDAVFPDDFTARVGDFLTRLPPDWDIAMLGGQHVRAPSATVDDGILRAVYPNRTHAFAIRGRAIRTLYQHWVSWKPGQRGHCDHMMAQLASTLKIYTPYTFIVAQGASLSDINGRINPTQDWAEPPRDMTFQVFLTAPSPTERSSLHFGNSITPHGWDKGLDTLFQLPGNAKWMALKEWARIIRIEAAKLGKEPALWHPMARDFVPGIQAAISPISFRGTHV